MANVWIPVGGLSITHLPVSAVTNTSAQADAGAAAPGRSLILRTAVLLSNDVAGFANGTNHQLTLVSVSSSAREAPFNSGRMGQIY